MARRSQVVLSKFAQKQIRRLPHPIQIAMQYWQDLIESEGIEVMRRIPGYHDEPLEGQRKGQRSSRLNRSYRVIYRELDSDEVAVIAVLEVNKHVY
jgi:proteic killer suppression protein